MIYQDKDKELRLHLAGWVSALAKEGVLPADRAVRWVRWLRM